MYQLNKTLLQTLTVKEQWQKLRSSVHLDRFDKEVRCVLNQIRKYWEGHDDTIMNMEVFVSKFFIDVKCTDKEREYYNNVFEIMTEKPDSATLKDIIRDLRTMEFSSKIEDSQNDYVLGVDVDLYETIRRYVNEFEADVRKDADTGFCTASIQEIIEDAQNGIRLPWMLKDLQNAMPDLSTGKQVIIAARPGKGKTSFVAHAITHMLQSDYMQESGRPVVWFNNEGYKIKIRNSCVRAALRMSLNEIVHIGWEGAAKKYNKIISGTDSIRVYDIHGKDSNYLERIIENDNPAIVVWDMLDNVKGFKSDRKDQQLESLYQWARECSVRYDFLSLPTSQISVEGSNMQWVPDNMLKDSKTGKQGACDAIITIGSVDKEGFENSRFIYVPKTKSPPVPGFPASCRTEVVFDGDRSLYLNPKKL